VSCSEKRGRAPSLVAMTTYIAVFAMVLGYLALVAAYCALRTLAKLRRATTVLARGSRTAAGKESLLQATERHAEHTAALAEQVADLHGHVEATCTRTLEAVQATSRDVSSVLRNIALVRYDAFADMSGRISFSLALLDERGDGVTISAIAGRTDTSVYAKGVAAGKGEHELSPEERQAVSSALHKQRSGLLNRKAG
jgi:hypothetical protein